MTAEKIRELADACKQWEEAEARVRAICGALAGQRQEHQASENKPKRRGRKPGPKPKASGRQVGVRVVCGGCGKEIAAKMVNGEWRPFYHENSQGQSCSGCDKAATPVGGQ